MNVWIERSKRLLQISHWWACFSCYGFFLFLFFRAYNVFFKFTLETHLNVKVLGKFFIRIGNSSDICVLNNILVLNEYRPLLNLKKIKNILDCGANIGISSRWFLHFFRDSEIIAIEPEQGNFSLLQKNLMDLSSRVSLVQGAVWSEKKRLKLGLGCGDGRNWSFACKENDYDTDTNGYDVLSLMKIRAWDRIDLLKMDIEGGESEVFSRNQNRWLPFVKNMTVETHGKTAQDALFKALQDYNYDYSFSGETHFILNLSPKHI